MKREGASTLFIHGYPWALSYLFRSLAFAFQLFEMVLCMCGFKNVLKRGHRCGNLCNDSCLNIYKGVCLLKRCFNVWKFDLWKCFKIVLWCIFENSNDVFASFDQVIKSYLPYLTQRSFLHIFNPFDSVVLPLHLVNNLVLGC